MGALVKDAYPVQILTHFMKMMGEARMRVAGLRRRWQIIFSRPLAVLSTIEPGRHPHMEVHLKETCLDSRPKPVGF